jgi:hypothetical protein
MPAQKEALRREVRQTLLREEEGRLLRFKEEEILSCPLQSAAEDAFGNAGGETCPHFSL